MAREDNGGYGRGRLRYAGGKSAHQPGFAGAEMGGIIEMFAN